MTIGNMLSAETVATIKWVYHYMMMTAGVLGLAGGLVFVILGMASKKLRRLGTDTRAIWGGVILLVAGAVLLAGGILLGRTC